MFTWCLTSSALGTLVAASACSVEPPPSDPAELLTQARAVETLLKRFTAQRVDATEYAYLKAVALFKPGTTEYRSIKAGGKIDRDSSNVLGIGRIIILQSSIFLQITLLYLNDWDNTENVNLTSVLQSSDPLVPYPVLPKSVI